MVEPLKPLDALFEVDARQRGRGIRNEASGAERSLLLADHYGAVAAFVLHEGVPENIRSHWQTTRHLSIYAWYVYAFTVVAEMHAFASLEMALRLRLPVGSYREDRPPTLGPLLRRAIEENWLDDAALGDWNPRRRDQLLDPPGDSHEYMRVLVEAIPGIRNAIAHGEHMLWPSRYHTLGLVSAAINALYPSNSVAPAT
jgi:hypothetical protein